jgi:threonyl-tRNA synthetase
VLTLRVLTQVSMWDDAEAALASALDKFCTPLGLSSGVDPGGGAFYGPKIDIQITDALGRCAAAALLVRD